MLNTCRSQKFGGDPFNFPGLKEGDRWCLRVTRWKETLETGVALRVDLEATHSYVFEFVNLEEWQAHALSSH
jgi:uncharacterized protein